MQADMAFRAMVMSAAHEALSNFQENGPQVIEIKDVHNVATEACMIALKRAFDGNAEIARLRAERDAYKEAALRFSALSPATPYFLATKE